MIYYFRDVKVMLMLMVMVAVMVTVMVIFLKLKIYSIFCGIGGSIVLWCCSVVLL